MGYWWTELAPGGSGVTSRSEPLGTAAGPWDTGRREADGWLVHPDYRPGGLYLIAATEEPLP